MEDSRYLSIIISLMLILFARPVMSAPWNNANDPRLIESGVDLEYKVEKLPLSGHVSKPIWGGDWFPLRTKGTARVLYDGLSPLQKLEKVNESSTGAHDWELWFSKENTYRWAGHCNGLAAAGVLEYEPKNEVIYKGVRFRPKEIRALLIELYQGPMEIVGERCESKLSRRDWSHDGGAKHRECRDLNPGTFHVLLTNYVGIQKKSLAYDRTLSKAVWNYPIITYSSKVKEITKKEAIQRANFGGSNIYTPNPVAARFYKAKIFLKTTHRKHKYKYIIEANVAGEVIGGEWVDGSKRYHPDFIWRPQGFSLENPYIDIQTVLDIYDQSMSP